MEQSSGEWNEDEDSLRSSDDSRQAEAAAAGNAPEPPSHAFEANRLLVEEQLRSLYPHVDQRCTPLPRRWNRHDRSADLIISHSDLRVKHSGRPMQADDKKNETPRQPSATIRADAPIPLACGLYYFEITVVTGTGMIGIGLADKNFVLERMPGWEENSYAYHGDDGNYFAADSRGVSYGPTFKAGDVVGCGINFVRREVFFTKNGQHLGIPPGGVKLSGALYPAVGLQNNGETVDANFGQRPFSFDLKQEIQDVQRHVTDAVFKVALPSPEKREWMNRMVGEWLIHQGFSRAWVAFESQTKALPTQNLKQLAQRKEVCRRIEAGDSATATVMIERRWPNLLRDSPTVAFALRCQVFAETAAARLLEKIASAPPPPVHQQPHYHQHPVSSSSKNGTTPKNGASTAPTTVVEEFLEEHHGDNGAAWEQQQQQQRSSLEEDRAGYSLFEQLVEEGRQLHALATKFDRTALPRWCRQLLADAQSLLCAAESELGPPSRLLTAQHLGELSQLVNASIIEHCGGRRIPELSRRLGEARKAVHGTDASATTPALLHSIERVSAAPFMDPDQLCGVTPQQQRL